MNKKTLRTPGDMTLIASTLAHVRTELEAPERLAALLQATVSAEWPPGEYDRAAMEFFRERLESGGAEAEGWYNWYGIRDPQATTPAVLIGAAGYFGPPDADGVVEIGYSVLPEWRRRGYAGEMLQALVENAFSWSNVAMVIAHTTEENPASIAVLARCGFSAAGPGRDAGSVRFERIRNSA